MTQTTTYSSVVTDIYTIDTIEKFYNYAERIVPNCNSSLIYLPSVISRVNNLINSQERISRDFYYLNSFVALLKYVCNISVYSKCWNVEQIDYFSNNFELFSSIDPRIDVPQWVVDNFGISSYINMLTQGIKKHGEEQTFDLLRDTFNQLNKICNIPNIILDLSGVRKRIKEFHDAVSKEYIIRFNENYELPTEIISDEVKADKYVIKQPKDYHSLIFWAKQVHNCVASYAERILEKKLAIFLVEEEETPKYTISVSLSQLNEFKRNKISSITPTEFKGVCNSSVDGEIKDKIMSVIAESIM